MTLWTRRHFFQGALGLALARALPAGSQPRPLRLVHWSDLHWGGKDDDAPACLEAWERGLKPGPDLILMTGDHGDNGAGEGDFEQRLAGLWGRLLPYLQGNSAPLLLCLGNSDFRNNYQTDSNTLAETWEISRRVLGTRYYLDELGNGRREAAGLTWISLNSQIFSPKNRHPGASEQGSRSLRWLREQLAASSGPAVILTHIPPCIDLYVGGSAWRPQDCRAFWQIVESHPRPCWVMGGHFHRNEVHAGRQGKTPVPLLVAGSLSRKYDYAPNWRSWNWQVGPEGLIDCRYRLHYPGHADWEAEYRIDDLQAFARQLEDPAFLSRYRRDLFAHHSLAERTEPWPIREQFWID